MDDLVLKHRGRVVEGKLRLSNLPLYLANLKELNGKEFELQIVEREEDVTKNQFNYYYGIIIPFALKQEVFGGWTKQDLDGYLKDMFLKEIKVKSINDVPVEIAHTPSKARIGKRKMTEFVSLVLAFLAKQGVVVPEEYEISNAYADRGEIIPRDL